MSMLSKLSSRVVLSIFFIRGTKFFSACMQNQTALSIRYIELLTFVPNELIRNELSSRRVTKDFPCTSFLSSQDSRYDTITDSLLSVIDSYFHSYENRIDCRELRYTYNSCLYYIKLKPFKYHVN